MADPLHYVHISDTHLGAVSEMGASRSDAAPRDWTALDNTPYRNFDRVVAAMWCNAQVGMLDGDKLHRALLPGRDRLRGVFFGHVHRGTQTLRDGILYTSVPSTFCQLNLWPDDTEVSFDTAQPPAFNFVSCFHDRTIVKEHSVPRD